MCGNAISFDDMRGLTQDKTIDVAITSPPYGESDSAKLRDHYEKGKEKRQSLYNSHDDKIEDWAFLIENAIEVMKTVSYAQFINIQMLADNKRDLIRIIDNHVDELVDIVVWDKQKAAPQMQSNVLNNEFEFVFIFCNDNPTRTIPFANFHGNTSNIIRLSVGQNEYADIHRAVFPVEFPASILRIASKANTVLDVFGGTGTTLIACEQMDKTCYMMELDPHYCDVIIQRWENLTGEKAVKLN